MSILVVTLLFLSTKNVKKEEIIFLLLWLPFLLYQLLVIVFNMLFGFKDIFFLFIPVYILFSFYTLNHLFKSYRRLLIKHLKIFLFINFIAVMFQYFDVLSTNQIFENLYKSLSISVSGADSLHYKYLMMRPIGIIGNPIKLAFIIFIVGESIFRVEKKFYVKVITYLIILVSGARMVLIASLLYEVTKFFHSRYITKSQLIFISVSPFILVIASLVAYEYIEFFQYTIDKIINGEIGSTHSFSHRFMKYTDLFNLDFPKLLFGGYSIYYFKQYVDSEIVMRIYQFGIIGLTLWYLPFVWLIIKNKFTLNALAVIVFLFLNTITSFVFTNLLYIPFVLLFIITTQYKNNENSLYSF
ncbi:hypothetical protein [Marivirga tractuosa]